MNAESAYLFRHALLREVAYQLQMPADRAKLHALAFAAIEALAGDHPPDPPPIDQKQAEFTAHESDAWAEELAGHARRAGRGGAAAWRGAEKRWVRRAAEVGDTRLQRGRTVELWKRHAELSDGAARGESLRRAGHAAYMSGKPAAAEALYGEALRILRETGARTLEGVALANVAQLLQEVGRWKEAAPLFDEAITILRAAGDRRNEVYARKQRAWLFFLTGDPRGSEAAYREALAIAAEANLPGIAFMLKVDITAVLPSLGREEEAAKDLRALLQDPEVRRQPSARGVILGNLSSILFQNKRVAEAEPILREALQATRDAGNRFSEGLLLGGMSAIHAEQGRLAEALAARRQALALHREISARHQEGLHLAAIASLLSRLGRLAEAQEPARDAVEVLREVGDPHGEGMARCELSLLWIQARRLPEAKEEWDRGARLLARHARAGEVDREVAAMRTVCAAAGVAAFEVPS